MQARGESIDGRLPDLRATLTVQRRMLKNKIDAYFATQEQEDAHAQMDVIKGMVKSGKTITEAMEVVNADQVWCRVVGTLLLLFWGGTRGRSVTDHAVAATAQQCT